MRQVAETGETARGHDDGKPYTIWACDFLPVTDLLFRPLFAFFIVELASRREIHIGVTRHPTDAWVAQGHALR
jgi:hypothetical protein